MSRFGWEILNKNGVVTADDSVIMSRRLGVIKIGRIDFSPSPQVFHFPVNISGGTPFVTVRTGVGIPQGEDGAYYPGLPSISFTENNTVIRVEYNRKMWAWPTDDITPGVFFYMGFTDIYYGVYNK